jgi:catechol 2,3-dioxygenase-like lactoylglutathione lyase family enzyme
MTHRQRNSTRVLPVSAIGILTWVLAVALLAMAAAAEPTTRPVAPSVDRISIVVSDAGRAADFLTRVLDFAAVSDHEVSGPDLETLEGVFGARCRVVRMVLGEESVELIEYLTPRGSGVPADSRSNDRWFQHIAIITSDMDKAYGRLRSNHVRYASTAPQTLPSWNVKAAGIKAFYFHDPDGHVLEVLQFPQGKGGSRWHRHDRLFLGIDHTAIVTSNTEQSLAFYRDRLGMKVAGESENWGHEQEHLNSVQGAHLRITTLRAASGPGVELLEYLEPDNGRPYPSDGRANDLFAWRTVIRVPEVSDASNVFPPRARVSVDPTRNPLGRSGRSGEKAWIGRDPDGHLIEFVGPAQFHP